MARTAGAGRTAVRRTAVADAPSAPRRAPRRRARHHPPRRRTEGCAGRETSPGPRDGGVVDSRTAPQDTARPPRTAGQARRPSGATGRSPARPRAAPVPRRRLPRPWPAYRGSRTVRPQPVGEAWSTGAEVAGVPWLSRRPPPPRSSTTQAPVQQRATTTPLATSRTRRPRAATPRLAGRWRGRRPGPPPRTVAPPASIVGRPRASRTRVRPVPPAGLPPPSPSPEARRRPPAARRSPGLSPGRRSASSTATFCLHVHRQRAAGQRLTVRNSETVESRGPRVPEMPEQQVSLQELESELDRYIHDVENGATVVVSRDGRQVARIIPETDSAEQKRAALKASGTFDWSGRRPKSRRPSVRLRDGGSVSDIIINERR